jgi:L-amino acid N-acyltransferase YncA
MCGAEGTRRRHGGAGIRCADMAEIARSPRFVVDAMAPADWPAVRAIYEAGIATMNATFETAAPDWDGWDATHLPGHRLVARDVDGVAGWAALAPVSGRCVYRGVAENSVYVAPRAQGMGVGRALLDALIAGSEADGIWTIQTGIFPENAASLALHDACGFRVVGIRERIGFHQGRWRDVVFLERRSGANVVDHGAGASPPEGGRQ